jgi:4-hydroxy-3-methylbut-2-enyl diphosphate reductase
MKIMLAGPRGFCAGVNMAIESLERALALFGAPLYVYHEIVHNRHVVDGFRHRGVVFVDEIAHVPLGGRLMYSAHGVAPEVRDAARRRGLTVIDATCPLVRKVHTEAQRFAAAGYSIVLIGHRGHDEVVGTLGEAPERMLLVETPDDVERLVVPDPDKLAYLTQTTLSVDDANRIVDRLKRRFPRAVGSAKEDICYATQNRQEAVKTLLDSCDTVLVVGSHNSSNSNRLVEVAREHGRAAHLVDGVDDLELEWFDGHENVLVTAGASAPEDLVGECVEWLCRHFQATVEDRPLRVEHVDFPLPLELR